MNYDHENQNPKTSEIAYDSHSEQALLGTLVKYPESRKLVENLASDHFFFPAHQKIFSVILESIGKNTALHPVDIAANSTADVTLALGQCILAGENIINVSKIARYITELYHRRNLISAMKKGISMLEKGHSTSEVLLVTKAVTSVAELDVSSNKFQPANSVTMSVSRDLATKPPCFSTGLSRLDDAMGGGLHSGKAYCFAARKKVGKSILAGTISHNLNMNGVKHLFICGEMGEKEVHQRVIARQLDIYPSAFLNSHTDKQKLLQDMADLARMSPNNAIYYDAPGISFSELKRAVCLAKLKYDISGFILDYWQLVGGKDVRQSDASHYGDVAQWIAEIGRTLGIWSITTAQINQEGNTRGGEGIRLSSDQVYEIHRPDRGKEYAWLEMLETRYTTWDDVGDKDNPSLRMNPRGPFFEEISPEQQEIKQEADAIFSQYVPEKPLSKPKRFKEMNQ